jgi:hypothetical protein
MVLWLRAKKLSTLANNAKVDNYLEPFEPTSIYSVL